MSKPKKSAKPPSPAPLPLSRSERMRRIRSAHGRYLVRCVDQRSVEAAARENHLGTDDEQPIASWDSVYPTNDELDEVLS